MFFSDDRYVRRPDVLHFCDSDSRSPAMDGLHAEPPATQRRRTTRRTTQLARAPLPLNPEELLALVEVEAARVSTALAMAAGLGEEMLGGAGIPRSPPH